MRLRRHIVRFMVGSTLLVAVTAAPETITAPPPRVEAAPAALGAGGEYHPLAPQRIYDSRPGSAINEAAPAPKGATPGQPTFDISLLGVGGVPNRPSDVLAVVVNITVTQPTAGGWLNAYGAGSAAGVASIINFGANQTVPNLSIVRPGADGKLTVKLFTQSASGSAHVVVDVFGWFSTSSNVESGARLVPITPGRILDTRESGSRQPLGSAQSVDLQIRGATLATGQTLNNSSSIVGAVLNVTGVNQQAGSTGTFLSVFPEPLAAGTPPSTSNVNLAAGQIKPNMVIVPIGTDGKIRLYNHAGALHVVVDVVGYLTTQAPGPRAGRVVPLTTPYRVFDTREAQWGAVALGPGQAEDWSFADFVNSVAIGGEWVGPQSAVIGNLTSAELKRQYPTVAVSSYLAAYPSDAARPNASNLNMVEGVPVPNLAILKYSNVSTVRVFNLAGFAHYLYDASAVVLAD